MYSGKFWRHVGTACSLLNGSTKVNASFEQFTNSRQHNSTFASSCVPWRFQWHHQPLVYDVRYTPLIRLFDQDISKLTQSYDYSGPLLIDDRFPADSSVLPIQHQNKDIQWVRPSEIVPMPLFYDIAPSPRDVEQGDSPNCYLAARAAALANRIDLFQHTVQLDNPITLQKANPRYTGLFHFRFWIFGCWYEVVVDDRLPTLRPADALGEYLVYGRSARRNVFWWMLLEKAFAKLCGGYQYTNSNVSCIELLTGGRGLAGFHNVLHPNLNSVSPREVISLAEAKVIERIKRQGEGELPQVMTTQCFHQIPSPDPYCMPSASHAYTILNSTEAIPYSSYRLLIHMRDPYGRYALVYRTNASPELRGAWTCAELGQPAEQREQPDRAYGDFVMTYSHWYLAFNSIALDEAPADVLPVSAGVEWRGYNIFTSLEFYCTESGSRFTVPVTDEPDNVYVSVAGCSAYSMGNMLSAGVNVSVSVQRDDATTIVRELNFHKPAVSLTLRPGQYRITFSLIQPSVLVEPVAILLRVFVKQQRCARVLEDCWRAETQVAVGEKLCTVAHDCLKKVLINALKEAAGSQVAHLTPLELQDFVELHIRQQLGVLQLDENPLEFSFNEAYAALLDMMFLLYK